MCCELRQLGDDQCLDLYSQTLWLPYCTDSGLSYEAFFTHYRLQYLEMLRHINTWTGRDSIEVCVYSQYLVKILCKHHQSVRHMTD